MTTTTTVPEWVNGEALLSTGLRTRLQSIATDLDAIRASLKGR